MGFKDNLMVGLFVLGLSGIGGVLGTFLYRAMDFIPLDPVIKLLPSQVVGIISMGLFDYVLVGFFSSILVLVILFAHAAYTS
ncbi:MAG: hypothetical protein BTN85_0230 [Candidatus Methanohalarchaeum thermophilum]|uniref:Uncharacterized protein n=1 Tax=Methanohalarchaeum thermophilum TaxID=1903181 RepID=A0A1Q6DTS0_METT1|nr:MAG: hypothetical protein BTN85_0230 [Candidatus Methanohalarchaeum thermophilum]